MAGVENRRQFIGVDHLINRIADLLCRVQILHDVVEFEAFNAVIFDQIPRFARTHLALVRIN